MIRPIHQYWFCKELMPRIQLQKLFRRLGTLINFFVSEEKVSLYSDIIYEVQLMGQMIVFIILSML